MKKVIIIFHKSCRDGYAAALTAYKYFHIQKQKCNLVFLPVFPEQVVKVCDKLCKSESSNTSVHVWDLSICKNTVNNLINKFHDVVIGDHHKTTWESCYNNNINYQKSSVLQNCRKIPVGIMYFDYNKCGCEIAWNHYFPNVKMPVLFEYLRDHDLWITEMPDSKTVNSGLNSLIHCSYCDTSKNNQLEIWGANENHPEKLNNKIQVPDFHKWLRYCENDDWINKAKKIGNVLIPLMESHVKRVVNFGICKIWHNYKTCMCNSTVYVSEIGNNLVTEHDYQVGFVWWQINNKCKVCLRSKQGSNVDVEKIAKQYGGGGHKHASGFMCSMSYLNRLITI